MTPFEGVRLRLGGVAVGELRVRKIGPSPVDMAKVTIVDDAMNPISFSIFSAFSEKSRRLIEAACRSIEADYIEYLTVPAGQLDGSDLDDLEDGEDDGDVAFR